MSKSVLGEYDKEAVDIFNRFGRSEQGKLLVR